MIKYCIVNKDTVYIIEDKELDDEIIEIIKNYDKIEFYDKFNKSIDKLPPNIKLIVFECKSVFDQTINNYPINLETIIFGNNFNNPLDNLPEGLKTLKLGINYTHSLDNLPQIKFLNIGDCEKIKITMLPSSIDMLFVHKNTTLPETINIKNVIVYDKRNNI